MRSAEITELSSPPVVAERGDPRPADGQLVLDVAAVALNPVDVAIAAGTFYAGHPPLAYIPAIEAVGWVGDRFVYAQGSGRGVATDGFLAERVVVAEADLIDLPEGTDPAIAAALGVAGATGWLATTARAVGRRRRHRGRARSDRRRRRHRRAGGEAVRGACGDRRRP